MRSELLLGAGPRVPIDPPGVGSPPGASGPTCVLITGVLMSAVPGAERQRTGIESPQLRKWVQVPTGFNSPRLHRASAAPPVGEGGFSFSGGQKPPPGGTGSSVSHSRHGGSEVVVSGGPSGSLVGSEGGASGSSG